MEFFKYNRIYNFVTLGRYTIVLSVLLICASIALFIFKGFSYSIDFKGGTIVQIQYENKAPIAKIRSLLEEHQEYKGFLVSEFGSSSEIIIKLPQSQTTLTENIGVILSHILEPTGKFDIRRIDIVGPKVGDELRTKGILALICASIGILIYVAFRYEWRFAIAALLALAHDIIICCGAIILFDIDFGLDIVAALLTILGYSINDTIIIFDRIRERLQKSTKETLAEVMNEAVSRTLSRTILTTLTMLFTLFALFFFGGAIIKGFTFSMLIGTFVGTYSSIFIAMLFVIWLGFDIKKYKLALLEKEKQKKEKQKLRSMYAKGTI